MSIPFQLVAQIPQLLVVDPFVHIAEDEIGFGGAADLEVFHRQLRIPDTPPDQGGVEDQGFHKAVVGPRSTLSSSGSSTPRAG